MKKTSLLKSAAAAGALLVSSTLMAGAATVQDQVNDANSAVSFNGELHWQQQVVAGITGTLNSIDLNFGSGSGVMDFFVNLGSGWQTDTDDFNVTVSGLSGWATIDVSSAGINLNAGDLFMIGFRNGTGGLFQGSVGETYAAGGLFLEGNPFSVTNYDFNFRTNVETAAAVPLPAGLPLLLAGMGALAVLRRKQKA
jgi:hypothetical protein